MSRSPEFRAARLRGYGVALILCAAVTAVLALLGGVADLRHVASVYLIPVLICAAMFGVGPAVLAAVAGLAAPAFLFYAPLYSLRVDDAQQVIDLVMFVGVAVVTGTLADRLRRQLQITRERGLELRALHGELRSRAETEALRDAFIGSISHELRTPLSSILGGATVLGQLPLVKQDERAMGLVGMVRDEADRLNGDIQNLLDATRVSGQGLQPKPEWIESVDVINSAAGRLRRRLARHDLAFAVAPELPLIYTDPRMLEQVLVQILDNAGKYSPPGGTITLRVHAAAAELVIEVADQGVGLTAEEQVHLWDRFYRGPRHVGDTPGSGLGLWIARAFVGAVEGRISASSPGPGLGTTITIGLPMRERAPVLEDADD